jgi:hypothetical protein
MHKFAWVMSALRICWTFIIKWLRADTARCWAGGRVSTNHTIASVGGSHVYSESQRDGGGARPQWQCVKLAVEVGGASAAGRHGASPRLKEHGWFF